MPRACSSTRESQTVGLTRSTMPLSVRGMRSLLTCRHQTALVISTFASLVRSCGSCQADCLSVRLTVANDSKTFEMIQLSASAGKYRRQILKTALHSSIFTGYHASQLLLISYHGLWLQASSNAFCGAMSKTARAEQLERLDERCAGTLPPTKCMMQVSVCDL